MERYSPHVTVACVIERQGRYLMVEEHRGGPLTCFNQPAGHVEPGEGPMAAIRREVEEETAWQIQLTGYLGLYVFQSAEGLTFYSHGFAAQPKTYLATPLDGDIHATHWLTLEELAAHEHAQRLRSPLVMQRLHDMRAGRLFPLSVIHE